MGINFTQQCRQRKTQQYCHKTHTFYIKIFQAIRDRSLFIRWGGLVKNWGGSYFENENRRGGHTLFFKLTGGVILPKSYLRKCFLLSWLLMHSTLNAFMVLSAFSSFFFFRGVPPRWFSDNNFKIYWRIDFKLSPFVIHNFPRKCFVFLVLSICLKMPIRCSRYVVRKWSFAHISETEAWLWDSMAIPGKPKRVYLGTLTFFPIFGFCRVGKSIFGCISEKVRHRAKRSSIWYSMALLRRPRRHYRVFWLSICVFCPVGKSVFGYILETVGRRAKRSSICDSTVIRNENKFFNLGVGVIHFSIWGLVNRSLVVCLFCTKTLCISWMLECLQGL